MKIRRWMTGGGPGRRAAFSLLEVMVAMAIFFVAIFAVLDLTNQSLGTARRLQRMQVDATGLASAVAMTNRLEEASGLPPEIVTQFEELNPGYTCTGVITEISTNGLFRVDLEIGGLREKAVVGSSMSILLFRPEYGRGPGTRLRR